VSFQSSGSDRVMPSCRVSGRLNTLIAYACPMQRCVASAHGGINQRLKPGGAIVRSLLNKPAGALITGLPELSGGHSNAKPGPLTSEPEIIARRSWPDGPALYFAPWGAGDGCQRTRNARATAEPRFRRTS